MRENPPNLKMIRQEKRLTDKETSNPKLNKKAADPKTVSKGQKAIRREDAPAIGTTKMVRKVLANKVASKVLSNKMVRKEATTKKHDNAN